MKLFKGQGTADLGKPWRFEEDGLTVTRGCAWSPPGCHPVGCGIKTYVNSNGELVRIEGDENHPVTGGRLRVRCLTMRDYVYNPDRVLYPMKRAREDRGKNKWERITWDEAFDTIAEKVAYYKENYGAESILMQGGTGREGGPMLPAYAQAALGTPNASQPLSGYSCYIPRVAGTTYVTGVAYPEMDYAGGLPGRYDDPAFKLPELIVFWGKDPLPTNGDGLFGHAAIDMMRRGSKLMSIDPRVNWVATRADWHLRLRPGTDTALGMAMLNVIIEEDLYDHDFVERWCYGFEQLAERVKEMPAEKAAEITGVDAGLITEAARVYAAAKPAQIAWGLAIDMKSNGMQAGHCILALEAITGNLDVPGGQLVGDVNDGLELGFGWKELGPELQEKILGLKRYPAMVSFVLNAHCDMVLDALETGEPYAFKMAGFEDCNGLAGTDCTQPQRWHDAYQNLEWCFGIDVWLTPTIQATCELFLPLSSTVEHDSVVYSHYGASPITMGAVNKSITVGEEPQLSPVSTPEKMEEYPFVLTTGARTYCYFHSEGKQIPYLREINPDPLIEINPQDALELGIADGQWVRVSNPFGSCVLKAKVTQTVYPGLVMAQHGFWFPEEDGEEPHLYDVWRSNINLLMPHFYVGELGFGAPYKCLICKVEPIEESHDTDMQAIWNRYSQLATPE